MSSAILSIDSQGSAEVPQTPVPVQLPDFGDIARSSESGAASITEVELRIELGKTDLSAVEADRLACDSVVRLDESAEEPVSVYADGQLFARGELVVVDNHYALRITELAVDSAGA